MQAVEQGFANLEVRGISNEDEKPAGSRSESCTTSSLTEAEVHFRFEELRSSFDVNGREGEYSETQYRFSKALHLFTLQTQAKRRANEGRGG